MRYVATVAALMFLMSFAHGGDCHGLARPKVVRKKACAKVVVTVRVIPGCEVTAEELAEGVDEDLPPSVLLPVRSMRIARLEHKAAKLEARNGD